MTGYMTIYAGWRSVYWLILAMSGALFLVTLFFYDETYAPVLLSRRAKRMRKETGDEAYTTAQERLRRPANDIIFEALARPIMMLTTELIMSCVTGKLGRSWLAGTTFLMLTHTRARPLHPLSPLPQSISV